MFRFVLLLLGAALFAPPVQAGDRASGTLTLRQALQRALSVNPRLTAADRDVGIATGRQIQAGAIPTPELSAEVENVLGSGDYRGFRSAETTLQISQLVELGGKREARLAAGRAEVDSAGWQREATRLEVLSETTSAFIGVLAAQRRVQILEQQVTAHDRLTPLLQRRVEAGASASAEVLRAQVAANLVRVELQRARTGLATARRELALLMGDGVPRFGQVAGNFSSTGHPPPLSHILSAIERNPQLIRWTSVRAQRQAELLTARLKATPDVKVGVGWRHFRETSDNAVTFGLSVAFPVWDQGRGDTIAASENLAKAAAERAVNKAALVSLAGRSYDAVTGALEEIRLLRASVLPDSRSAARSVEEGYGQGRFSLLDMLDVQATAAEAELREQEALKSYHVAIATIEGLVGRPFVLTAEKKR